MFMYLSNEVFGGATGNLGAELITVGSRLGTDVIISRSAFDVLSSPECCINLFFGAFGQKESS